MTAAKGTAGLAVTQLNIAKQLGAAAPHWGLNFDVKKLYLEPHYTTTVNNAIPVSGRAYQPVAGLGRRHL